MKVRESLLQFVRYGIVGVVNTLVTLASYWLLKWAGTGIGAANALSYALGMACSFTLNKRWTFRAAGRRYGREVALFVAGGALCWGVQWLAFKAMLTAGVPEVVAQVAGMVVYTVLNFLFNKCITFSKPRTHRDEQ